MSTTTTTIGVVGTPLDRVDGRLKVMGAATYPIDADLSGIAYAVLVGSTVVSGRILEISAAAAFASSLVSATTIATCWP